MLKRLTERIYYMPHKDDTCRPALGLVRGDKYSLAVDAGNSSSHAEDFMKDIKSLNAAPLKYTAITHHHFDHTFGIGSLDEAEYIANIKTKKEFEKFRNLKYDDESLKQCIRDKMLTKYDAKCIMAEISDRENFKLGNIDIEFSDEQIVDLGGITCILKNVPSSHTDDSTIIYIPEEKVMFLGDCAYTSSFNGKIIYDKAKTLQMIDSINKYDAEYYVWSHGTLSGRVEVCGKKEMLNFENQLIEVSKAVQENFSYKDAVKCFEDINKKSPSNDETFLIKCFINGMKSCEK